MDPGQAAAAQGLSACGLLDSVNVLSMMHDEVFVLIMIMFVVM